MNLETLDVPFAVISGRGNYSRDHSVVDGMNYVAIWNAAMLGGHMPIQG